MVTPIGAQADVRDATNLDLLVIAPAGCGKTEALALRVASLVLRGEVTPPQRVLVTTFSNRGRDNIKERLHKYLSPVAMRDRVTVSNFHGLAARIFRAHANVIGLDPELLIPESDWVGEQCRQRNLGFDCSQQVQDLLRVAKQEARDDLAVQGFLRDAGGQVALELELQRVSERRLTYDDLPRLAELILDNEIVVGLYRHHFQSIVVDEFQDLTLQQLRIVRRLGFGRTTYAGDLAQGIYGFAGAAPDRILPLLREECSTILTLSESHRSSPAVLDLVNALSPRTGGQTLTSAAPASWPHGGLAGCVGFSTTTDESEWTVRFARCVLTRAPGHRIGVITRTTSRRRFTDDALMNGDLPCFRWDDAVLDTETARLVAATLARIADQPWQQAEDLMGYLRSFAGIDVVHDPGTREAAVNALGWCCDLLRDGVTAAEIRSRIRVGNETTLLSASGVHLLTGHVGKGQQFDWVVVLGAEDGCIPDFRAKTQAAQAEEARVLSVMLSRARHGAVVLHATNVEALSGTVWPKVPSPFLDELRAARSCLDLAGIDTWLETAPWDAIAGS